MNKFKLCNTYNQLSVIPMKGYKGRNSYKWIWCNVLYDILPKNSTKGLFPSPKAQARRQLLGLPSHCKELPIQQTNRAWDKCLFAGLQQPWFVLHLHSFRCPLKISMIVEGPLEKDYPHPFKPCIIEQQQVGAVGLQHHPTTAQTCITSAIFIFLKSNFSSSALIIIKRRVVIYLHQPVCGGITIWFSHCVWSISELVVNLGFL